MNIGPGREPFWIRHAALFISGGYCLVSLIYIWTSDELVYRISEDLADSKRFQLMKGSMFVIVTSILLLLVMHMAFSRLRRSREAERAADLRFRRMIETTNEGVWMLDEAGTTTFVNDTMAEMLKSTPEEIIGRPQTLFLDEQWHDFAMEQFERRKQGHRDHYECEFQCQDGSRVWVNIAASPITGPNGEFAGSLRMVTDISSLKKTEQALKVSLKSQRMLLNELDHRVRNNLSSLVSLVDICRGAASDVGAFAESIRGRIEAMNRAYGLLSASGWKQQDLHRLLHTLIPAKLASRIDLAGPQISFAPYLSGAVAITIHELLSNAMQHGALSNESGRVGITWRITDADAEQQRIELRWTEGDGPEILGPVSTSAGLQLVMGLVESDLQGEVKFDFPIEGARHVLILVLDTVNEEEEAQDDQRIAAAEAPTTGMNGQDSRDDLG